MNTATAATLTESRFDEIVSGFYDAATGGRAWMAALDALPALFGARAVVLHTADIVDGRMHALDACGPEIDRISLDYVTGWERHDPRKHRVLALGRECFGQWLHCHDAFDDSFRAHSRYYRHFMNGHDAGFNSTLVIPIDARTITGFALELHAGRQPLDTDERELARRLGHHMQQALLSHGRMRRLASEVMVGHQLLRSFGFPMWLLDLDRRVQYANEAATALEAEAAGVGFGITRRDSRLRLAGEQADRLLTVRLHELARAAHGTRAHVRLGGAGSMAADAGWLHLSLLEPAAVMGLAFGAQRCVLATLFRPGHLSSLDPYALARMFDLTPTESRVAALLGEGLDPKAITERLNVKMSTVRTHIRRVLISMGQTRMTDAVRVLREGQMLWSAAGGTPAG